jgi:hypothetical protein
MLIWLRNKRQVDESISPTDNFSTELHASGLSVFGDQVLRPDEGT